MAIAPLLLAVVLTPSATLLSPDAMAPVKVPLSAPPIAIEATPVAVGPALELFALPIAMALLLFAIGPVPPWCHSRCPV